MRESRCARRSNREVSEPIQASVGDVLLVAGKERTITDVDHPKDLFRLDSGEWVRSEDVVALEVDLHMPTDVERFLRIQGQAVISPTAGLEVFTYRCLVACCKCAYCYVTAHFKNEERVGYFHFVDNATCACESKGCACHQPTKS